MSGCKTKQLNDTGLSFKHIKKQQQNTLVGACKVLEKGDVYSGRYV